MRELMELKVMKYWHLCGLMLAAAVGAGLVLAQEQAPQPRAAAGANEVDDAIRAVSASFAKAYNAKDARALGDLFTEGAEIEDDDGTITRGRDAIVDRYARRFKEGGEATVELTTESIHYLSPTLAIETGVVAMKDAAGPPEENRYSVLYTRQDGRWLHARIKDESPEVDSANEHLKELEWLRGEWINESDDALVTTTCDWSDDGAFLVRKFNVQVEGQVSLKGTQRIGWDPVLKQFRTWVFDDQGGFAEGLMARDGDRCIVKLSAIRVDGQSASATNIITRLGPDRFSWESRDRTLGGVVVPGVDEFTVVRKPPEPGR
jgi:uncharacterized protein (TIGR02246 family)